MKMEAASQFRTTRPKAPPAGLCSGTRSEKVRYEQKYEICEAYKKDAAYGDVLVIEAAAPAGRRAIPRSDG